MLASPRLLLDDYNEYRSKTYNAQKVSQRRGGGFAMRPLRPTPDRIKRMEEMQAWCEDHGVDSRQWLYFLFNDVRKWLYAPDLKKPGQLTPAKYVDRFRETAVSYQYTLKAQTESQERAKLQHRSADPQVDLVPTAENTKGRYRAMQRPDICMSVLRETYGYHPKSKHCPACSYAQPCREATRSLWPFDVVAIRESSI